MTDLDKMALLPCPFCGSPDVKLVTFKDEDGDVLHAAGCPKCKCNGAPHIAAMDDPRPAAAAAWNKRAPLTAPPGYVLVPLQEEQWTDQMRDAGRAAVMAAQCATATWTPRQHYKASGRSVAGIPEDVLDERGPLTKESIAVMVMGSMIAAAQEPK